MMLSLLALAAASAMPFGDQVHQTKVESSGRTFDVSYRPDTKLSTRKIGMSFGSRQRSERCVWTARVDVVRDVQDANGVVLSQRLGKEKHLSGSHFGKCSNSKQQVAREIARHSDTVSAHLASVAMQDGPVLAANLNAIRQFAIN